MELASLEEALKQARETVHEETRRLREELQEKHEAELSALRSDIDRESEEERTRLEKALDEEKEKLKSLQTSLDNDDSKIIFDCSLWFPVTLEVLEMEYVQVVLLLQLVTCLSFRPPGLNSEAETGGPI